MSLTPFEYAEGLRIGAVEFVSPDEIKVLLEIQTPDSVALNAGTPRAFPRVNSYVLIPNDDGYLVGQVEWMTVERSNFPKRRGMQDFGLIDLPYPLRKMSLNPLGTLRKKTSAKGPIYKFQRGVDAFPTIGDGVFLPTDTQLRSIVESGENRHVQIGTSPLAGNAEVCIDPDRLFGRHLAVLGNTGSGKSCSVAGLIRWSIEAAKEKGGRDPNAHFIVLDPNGEYTRAFVGEQSGIKTRIFKVSPKTGELPLHVPLWFWNSAEWNSFTQASGKTQRPLLRRALREVRAGRQDIEALSEEEQRLELRRYLSSSMITIQKELRSGSIKTESTKFGYMLKAMFLDLEEKQAAYPDVLLSSICDVMKVALTATYDTFTKDGKVVKYYHSFTEAQVKAIVTILSATLDTVGGIIYQEGPDEDSPIPFKGTDFADHLQMLAGQEGVSQFLDFLVMRIRTMLSDTRMKTIVGDPDSSSLDQWLTEYIGSNKSENGSVTIIDLSLVPTEVIHIVVAVIARLMFEAHQRYRKLKQVALPTVLVMEEAHTFIKRYKEDVENQNAGGCKKDCVNGHSGVHRGPTL